MVGWRAAGSWLAAAIGALLLVCAGCDVEVEAEMGWLDALPAEDATTLYGCNALWMMPVCARSLVAECFEQR